MISLKQLNLVTIKQTLRNWIYYEIDDNNLLMLLAEIYDFNASMVSPKELATYFKFWINSETFRSRYLGLYNVVFFNWSRDQQQIARVT